MQTLRSSPSEALFRPAGVAHVGIAIEIPALTGLRGVAALMVLGYHTPWLAGVKISDLPFGSWLNACDSGVGLFFALSAFLLSRPFWNRLAIGGDDNGAYQAFLVRRFCRIFPAYLIVVGFSLLFDNRTWTGWGLINLALHATALQTNLHQNFVWMINNVLWTVSVEVQFYLFLAGVFFIGNRMTLLRKGRGWPLLAAVIVIGLAADPFYRVVAGSLAPHVPVPLLGGRNADSSIYTWNACYFLKWFLPGVAAGWLSVVLRAHDPSGVERSWAWANEATFLLLLFAIVFLISCGAEGDWRMHKATGWPLNALLFAGLVFMAPLSRLGTFLFAGRALLFFGTISYGLYLWHYPLLRAIGKGSVGTSFGGWPTIFLVAITGLAVSSVVAFLSYQLVERPAIESARKCRTFRELWKAWYPQFAVTRVQG